MCSRVQCLHCDMFSMYTGAMVLARYLQSHVLIGAPTFHSLFSLFFLSDLGRGPWS